MCRNISRRIFPSFRAGLYLTQKNPSLALSSRHIENLFHPSNCLDSIRFYSILLGTNQPTIAFADSSSIGSSPSNYVCVNLQLISWTKCLLESPAQLADLPPPLPLPLLLNPSLPPLPPIIWTHLPHRLADWSCNHRTIRKILCPT